MHEAAMHKVLDMAWSRQYPKITHRAPGRGSLMANACLSGAWRKDEYIARLIIAGVALLCLIGGCRLSLPQTPSDFSGTLESFVNGAPSSEACQGETFEFTLTLTNDGDQDSAIVFPSSRTHRILVYNASGQEVWDSTWGKAYLAVVITEPIPAGGSFTVSTTWDLTDNDGNPVPPGTYSAFAEWAGTLDSGAPPPVPNSLALTICSPAHPPSCPTDVPIQDAGFVVSTNGDGISMIWDAPAAPLQGFTLISSASECETYFPGADMCASTDFASSTLIVYQSGWACLYSHQLVSVEENCEGGLTLYVDYVEGCALCLCLSLSWSYARIPQTVLPITEGVVTQVN